MEKVLKKMKENEKGFTLIELIVVIAIIGILAAVLLPKFSGFTDKARDNAVRSEAKNVYTAYVACQTEKGTVAGTDIIGYLGKSPQGLPAAGISINTIAASGTTPATTTLTYDTTVSGKTYHVTIAEGGVVSFTN